MKSILIHMLALGLTMLWGCNSSLEKKSNAEQQPNILLIFTDQQHVGMMSAVGNPHVYTPNLDRIAKLSLYQESATVPLIVSWPKNIEQDRIDERNLVSQIDIVPTLCDYAEIITEVQFTGQSLLPVLENPEATWRDYLVVELADFKPDRGRKGRMVRS